MKRRLFCVFLVLALMSISISAAAEQEDTTPAGLSVGLENTGSNGAAAGLESTVPPEVTSPAGITLEAGGTGTTEQDGSGIVNVIVPTSVDFNIDPFGLMRRGQIYSKAYIIKNIGDTDVSLTLTDMEVIFTNNTDFKSLSQPFDESSKSGLKSVYLLLNFGKDIPPVVITGPRHETEVSIPLYKGGTDTVDTVSSISFWLSGSVNPYPDKAWQTGDVKIRFNYSLNALSAPAQERDTAETASGISSGAIPETSPGTTPGAIAYPEAESVSQTEDITKG